MRQSLPMRGFRFDFVSRGECSQQRLRLGDLGHFRRRRKAFERGREDGVGFGGAAGRLIELGERKRRAQTEAARSLLLSRRRWRTGRLLPPARGWRGRASAGFRRAPGAVRLRMRDADPFGTSPALRRESQARGRHRPRGLRLRRAQSSTARRRAECSVRAEVRPRGACPRAPRRARRSEHSPSHRKKSRTPLATSAVMLTRESGEFDGVRRGAREVAAHQFEQGRMAFPVCARADMGEARDPRLQRRRSRETARSTSPRGHNISAR